jgi:hypothetical protein
MLAGRRTREPFSVGKLAAKIETAEEAEDLTESCAGRAPKPSGEGKRRPVVKQKRSALAAAMSRRKKKDSEGEHLCSMWLPRAIPIANAITRAPPA